MNSKIPRRVFAVSCGAFLGFAARSLAAGPRTTVDVAQIGEPDLYSFTMSGTERHFGRFSAFGEVTAFDGKGVVVLTAADGAQIVGVLDAAAEQNDPTRGHFHFSWRDSVVVGGQAYVNTGRFAEHRPTGLVVITIIVQIAFGVLLPIISAK